MKILFADGTAGYSPNRLMSRACGGISTSLTIIPQYLASMGHEVYVKSIYEKSETVEGVRYLPFMQPSPKIDVLVLNRNMINRDNVNGGHSNGSKVIWWLHDIVDPRYLEDGGYRDVDGIVSLSDYCTATYSDFYDIPKEKFHKIPNGVDMMLWHPGPYEGRDPNLFVMASAPIKGYRPMEFLFHNLKRNIKDVRLRIYSSQKLHDAEDNEFIKHWMETMRSMGAEVLDPIPQHELAGVFRKAWMLLMPNSYPEICSNLILQSRASGLPVATSSIGSATEFIEDGVNGLLTCSHPHDMHFWSYEFSKKVIGAAKDKELHRSISEAAPAGVKDWDYIGKEWDEYLQTFIEQN